MSKNILVPTCLAAMIASGALAGLTTFQYSRGVDSDRYYAANGNALQNGTLNSITLAMRAASDATYIAEMESATAQVDTALSALRNGNQSAGIPPLPDNSASNLYAFDEAWSNVLAAVEEISKSRGSNSAFPRLADESRKQVEALVEQAQEAMAKVEAHPGVQPKVREALVKALNNLVDGSDFLLSGATINSDSIRLALESITAYINTLAQVGNALPRDNALVEPLLKSYRTAQTAQRATMRAAESANGTVDNGPHARAIWAERARLETALNSLQHSISSIPSTRPVTAIIVLGSVGLALAIFFASVILILREAKARTRHAEVMGTTIQSSQKERSKELHQLFDEMEKVRNGDLTTEFTVGLGTTNEIAETLNNVFSKFRSLVKDVQQTIVSLSAASEQTLTMARNVNRNRQEQDSAIQHITKQNEELNLFIKHTESLTTRTKDSSQLVMTMVKDGSSAVQDVHEGVVKLSQSNMNIMHHTKAMTENIQSLGRLVEVVRKVANQSSTVAYNAFLVADAITDDNLSKRIRRSAEAMQQLTSSANEAVEHIETSLRGINDAAKDTQYVLDDSQKEIKELSSRSRNALDSLNSIREQTTQLAESIISVTEQTSQLKSQSEKVAETMNSIHHYASENSAASEQTASAINNLNTQAQRVGETLSHFKV